MLARRARPTRSANLPGPRRHETTKKKRRFLLRLFVFSWFPFLFVAAFAQSGVSSFDRELTRGTITADEAGRLFK
jgi:hypothetical protein